MRGLRESHALDRERRLVEKGLEQPLLLGQKHSPEAGGQQGENADRAGGALKRKINGIGPRQGVGAATGDAPVIEYPLRDAEIGAVQGMRLAFALRIDDAA